MVSVVRIFISTFMKTCTRCHTEKPFAEFNRRAKSASGYAEACKVCHGAKTAVWYQENKISRRAQQKTREDQLRRQNSELKAQRGCALCPEHEPVCLDWHHPDPSVKEGDPSSMLTRSWEAFLREIEKCVCLCSNCHRKVNGGVVSLIRV